MGRVKKLWRAASIKKSFAGMVLVMTAVVTAAALITIGICAGVKSWLVPITDEVMLRVRTETKEGPVETMMRVRANGEEFQYPIMVIDNDAGGQENNKPLSTVCAIEPIASPGILSPKRRLLYDAMSICMVAMPMIYAVAGIILCSILFYRKKLARPLAVLSDGAQRITNNDLDFTITCEQKDELGKLCGSFEKMRAALLDSERAKWKVMEERRQLNASVAHDLRTPITIIEGYTEYLQRNMKTGKVSEEKLSQVIENLSQSAKRLEHYVNSVRDIQSLEDMALKRTEYVIAELVKEVAEEFALLSENTGKQLLVAVDVPENRTALLDRQIFFRILENVVSNALRYADEKIQMRFALAHGKLSVTVSDDGPGFSEEALRSACTPFYKGAESKGHIGLGLSICAILCKKHGGAFTVCNAASGGGVVVFEIDIESK